MTRFTPRSRGTGTPVVTNLWRALFAATLLLIAIVPNALAVDVEYEVVSASQTAHYDFGELVRHTPRLLTGDPIDYSNIQGFQGAGFRQGGATLQGTNTITRLVADDISPTGNNAGATVIEIAFSVANFNTTPVSVRARIRFWHDSGSISPGTYYDDPPPAVGYSFPALLFQPGVTVVTGTLPPPPAHMVMPGVLFWSGVTFDNNNGTSGATAAQLDNFGQGLFDPPTVGASGDGAFLTDAAGSFFGISNPAGTIFNFGGAPPANFGWEFVVEKPVPASSSSWGRIKNLYR